MAPRTKQVVNPQGNLLPPFRLANSSSETVDQSPDLLDSLNSEASVCNPSLRNPNYVVLNEAQAFLRMVASDTW